MNCSEKKNNYLLLFSYGLSGRLAAHACERNKKDKACTDSRDGYQHSKLLVSGFPPPLQPGPGWEQIVYSKTLFLCFPWRLREVRCRVPHPFALLAKEWAFTPYLAASASSLSSVSGYLRTRSTSAAA